jgi:hypothetical protein
MPGYWERVRKNNNRLRKEAGLPPVNTGVNIKSEKISKSK